MHRSVVYEQMLLDMVIEAFRDRVHLHRDRWYSRDPAGLWVSDRYWGKRLTILARLHRDQVGTPVGTWPVTRTLVTEPGQYAFLARHVPTFLELPPPGDFPH